jgi:hypothetical protein
MPCSITTVRPFSIVIKYVDFSWGDQWLFFTTVWRLNTAQVVVPSNNFVCILLMQTPGPLSRSALASNTSNRDWNSRLGVSVSERVSLMAACTLMCKVIVSEVIGYGC